jgi:hypothetical protein
VKNGQHRTVVHRIEKLVGVPGGGQWAGFRLAIANNTTGDQVRIVPSR